MTGCKKFRAIKKTYFSAFLGAVNKSIEPTANTALRSKFV
jgi:hypothetical protein